MTSSPTPQVLCLGDVHGNASSLAAALERAGADPATGRLPAGLSVVQVGDLLHRGDDVEAVVALVDRFLQRHPDRWVQLAGNHELRLFGDQHLDHLPPPSATATATVRRWADDGRLHLAAAVTTDTRRWLVTHAGLTPPLWSGTLSGEADPAAAAAHLNALWQAASPTVRAAGIGVGRSGVVAGPLWADTVVELVVAWHRHGRAPFGQLHGHGSPWDAARGGRRPWVPADVAVEHVCPHIDGVRVTAGGQPLWSLDGGGHRPVAAVTLPGRLTCP